MADLLTFLRECAASGALLASICGSLVIPLFAWLAIRAFAPYILRMHDDAPWQAPLAAIAATIPPAVFLALSIIGVLGAASSGCLSYVWGRILFGAIVAFVVLALGRASIGAYRRSRQVRRLIVASQAPDAPLYAIAQRCGVRIRVLPYSEPFCALAGFWRPIVLVSTQTLERLSAEELEAAFRHERAHAARFDLMLGAALNFFADLLPFPSGDLVEAYAKARETAADEHAVRDCAPEALASAIVRLAAAKPMPRATAALTESGRSIKHRLAALLDDRAARIDPRGRRMLVATSLAAIMFASFLPAVLFALKFVACTMQGPHV